MPESVAESVAEPEPYYRPQLAWIHHAGFGFHGDLCAPGILSLLEPVLEHRGLVVEVGCGSGALTRHLVAAGHRVLATDGSPAMLDLARREVPGAEGFELLRLPSDPVPEADAVISVGHVLNYLDDEASVHLALTNLSRAVRPGGVLAIDLCDLEWGRVRQDQGPLVRKGDGWFVATERSTPAPDSFVRHMTTFVEQADGSWRRDDEVHHNVLLRTSTVPALLERLGIAASVRPSFGDEVLPAGLVVVVGRRPLRARR